MPNPPTLVSGYEGSAGWASTATPKTTGQFNADQSDVLVALLGDANDNPSDAYTFSSSPVETWTEDPETTGTSNSDAFAQIATAILSANRTNMTVSINRTGGDTVPFNILVAHFTDSDGLGATVRSTSGTTGAPSLSITTDYDNSALVYLFIDWNAGDGSTRTHRTVNGYTPTAGNGQELLYFRNTTDYAVYAGYIPDAGSAGSKTVGLTAPTGQRYIGIAREIRGSGVPISNTLILTEIGHQLVMEDGHTLLTG